MRPFSIVARRCATRCAAASCVLLGCALLARPVAAQDSTAVPSDSARREAARRDSVQALKRVTVTAKAGRRGYAVAQSSSATRTDTPLRDTPQAITVVSRTLIADQAMQGMTDVARYTPGVVMAQGEGNRDAAVIRGNSSTADFFVDGVRDDAQYMRDLYNVERVEALKGANAMTFGRGGGGGVINRVEKTAGWSPVRSLVAEGGSWDHRRAALDVGQGAGPVAARLNGMAERSASYRDVTELRRWGLAPTATAMVGARTIVHGGYEHFEDERTADRGIPSFAGRPSRTGISTFFGDPDVNRVRAHVDAATATIDHAMDGGLALRNRTRWTRYDKFYQNLTPGAVSADASSVNLTAYNNATQRANVFNQTDVTWSGATGALRHVVLVGAELGRQATDNFRNTGYFGGDTTTLVAPFAHPTVSAPVTFRQSATDADNHVVARIAAAYAQEQLALGAHWQAIAGVRYDRFALALDNHRNGSTLARDDRLVSPRGGLVFKPAEPVSFYGSWGVSYLPSAGDQFASLNATTQALEPERFTNRELGAKWDVHPALALTAAAYRLDRTNTSAKDPRDPTRTVQTGAQRTTGWELGIAGSPTERWDVAGGWAVQRALIVSTTTAAKAGATVPLVPHHTLSLWNRVQLLPSSGIGVGVIHQAASYAAVDNTVRLPAFTRLDAALFVRLLPHLRAQLNVENLLDARYWPTSQGNNNIMPGAPRTVRLSVMTGS